MDLRRNGAEVIEPAMSRGTLAFPSRRARVKCVLRRGREYFYYRLPSGRLVALGSDRKSAYAKAQEYDANGAPPPSVEPKKAEEVYRARLVDMFDTIEKRTRNRAKKSGWEATITHADVIAMMERQNWRCAMTGLKFDAVPAAKVRDIRVSALRPSIDRIDSSKGYTVENCRIVCHAINLGMGQWGAEVYLRLAKAAIRFAEGAGAFA